MSELPPQKPQLTDLTAEFEAELKELSLIDIYKFLNNEIAYLNYLNDKVEATKENISKYTAMLIEKKSENK
jgi:hypothetical protein